MRLRAFLVLFLYSFSLFGADPAPAGLAPVVLPMQGAPAPIIIFNYGTYNGGLPASAAAAALPAVPVAAATPSLGVETTLPRLSDDGFRLSLGGGMAGKNLNEYALAVGLELRFLEYLGIEGRVTKTLSGTPEAKSIEVFVGPKVQLPLKSSLFNFTPGAGLGYGVYEVAGHQSGGPAAYVKAEVEIASTILISGKYETALSRGIANERLKYSGMTVVPETGYEYGDAYPSPAYDYYDYVPPQQETFRSLSLRGGVRVSPRTVLSVEYAERGFGADVLPAANFHVELRF